MSDSNKGPDEAKIKVSIILLDHFIKTPFVWQRCMFIFLICQALLERTGYTLDVTTGQRKYGGPPPESTHSGAQPTVGTEVRSDQ